MGCFSLAIADMLDQLHKARYFCSIDLARAYHKARIAAGDTHKNYFLTNESLYKYIVVPFGLCCILAAFQKLMILTIC